MRFLPSGPRALLVEVDSREEVVSLHAEVTSRRRHGWQPSVADVVPGAVTLLVDGLDDPAAAAAEMAGWALPAVEADQGPTIEIACVYDGPDLPDVAAQWGVSVREVAELHSSILHSVAFSGFNPGFAYLAGLPADRAVARRDSPRPRVPAGSVAVGGLYTGVYPRSSPGGWQLIGRTDAVLWDEHREPPALLAPGTLVRFVPAAGGEGA